MNNFVVPSLTSRVETLYTKRLEKIRDAVVHAINTIPFVESDDGFKIKFSIQMHIPEDLWSVMQDRFGEKEWRLYKDTNFNSVDREYDIQHIAITHLRVR